jgi:kinesin family protein 13
MKPTASGKYADQNKVNTAVGKSILDNAWQGYHCCLFAYGQTGSGKSYSMIGYGENKVNLIIYFRVLYRLLVMRSSKELLISLIQIFNLILEHQCLKSIMKKFKT